MFGFFLLREGLNASVHIESSEGSLLCKGWIRTSILI